MSLSSGRFDADVAIVGGGPGGTSTALHLVRRERVDPSRVVILEKARHPREKPCAGAVSAWGLDALEAIGVALDVPHAPMRGLRVLAGNRSIKGRCMPRFIASAIFSLKCRCLSTRVISA